MARVVRVCWLIAISVAAATLVANNSARASDTKPPSAGYDALAQTLVERAQDEVAQVKLLVQQGTLPRTRLVEAENHLDDARDQLVLTKTLYGPNRLQDMTDEQARTMVEAAERRVDRQRKIVQSEQNLVDSGILAHSEFGSFEDELQSRERVLELARNRMRLLAELKQMAEAEQRLEHGPLRASEAALSGIMIRYDGVGSFNMSELPAISNEFQKKFGRPLPVSALGQTALHRSMGLDHRNRVDVSLSPDGTEGVWLRHLLERLRIPYLGFRAAVAGAATAPHIHIGPGSTRLAFALR